MEIVNDVINSFIRQQKEHTERSLAELITKYDFIVGSKECKFKLMEMLPEGANIVCSPYIEDPTTIYAIKRFDATDLIMGAQAESEDKEDEEQKPVLDKVRAEIENHCGLVKENHCKYCSYCNSVMGVREILEIIDKHTSLVGEPQKIESKTGYCKDCKWWKDSDGVYRRGIGAESGCPINRKEVYDGNGYCFLFEKKESEDE